MSIITVDRYTLNEIIWLYLFRTWFEIRFGKRFEMPKDMLLNKIDSLKNVIISDINLKYDSMTLDYYNIYNRIMDTGMSNRDDIKNIILSEKKDIESQKNKNIEEINNLNNEEVISKFLNRYNLNLNTKELEKYDNLHFSIKQLFDWGFFIKDQNKDNESNIIQLMLLTLEKYWQCVGADNISPFSLNFDSDSFFEPSKVLNFLHHFKLFGLFGEENTQSVADLMFNLVSHQTIYRFNENEIKGKRKKGGQRHLLESEFLIKTFYLKLGRFKEIKFRKRNFDFLKITRDEWVWNFHKQLKSVKEIDYKRVNIKINSLTYRDSRTFIEKASKYKPRTEDNLEYIQTKNKFTTHIRKK